MMSKLENILHNYDANEQRQDDVYTPLTSVIANSLDAYGVDLNGLKNSVKNNGMYHKVIASVDLGTLTWTLSSTNTFLTESVRNVMPVANSVLGNAKCDNYPTIIANNISSVSKGLVAGINSKSYQIAIKDTSYSDVTTFKNAMAGVILYYEIDVPVDEIVKLVSGCDHIKVDFGSSTLAVGNFDLLCKVTVPKGKSSIIVGGYTLGSSGAKVNITAVYWAANYVHIAGNATESSAVNPSAYIVFV